MKKLAILIENLFDEKELIYPYFRLKEDFEVHLVGSQKDTTYTGKSGLVMKSTHGSADVKADDYAGILIPGGFSPDNMRRTESTKDLVKEFCSQNKPIAAICHGPWMMASCCDLKGKDMTSFFSIKDDLINAGANWVDREVVVSGNLITSRNPNDLPVFVKTFVDAVK
ncbi:MAG: type 1 glutamine amidotransferase [Gudongella sp.]|nr:type 1 glutamine amidotransferase [Gudongella sp.]